MDHATTTQSALTLGAPVGLAAASLPELSGSAVHLWQASLAPDPATYAELAAYLTSHEREHARRFRLESDRRRSVAARGWLRSLLGGYLGLAPQSVALTTGVHGKPVLDNGSSHWLRFNVSHSNELAVYAVARGRDVGVDVECVDLTVDIDGLACRCLSAVEQRAMYRLASDDRRREFFSLWARKEAVLKAAGLGLHAPPQSVEVLQGQMVRLPAQDGLDRSQWWVSDFQTQPGYAAAVAVQAGNADVAPDLPGRGSLLTEAGRN